MAVRVINLNQFTSQDDFKRVTDKLGAVEKSWVLLSGEVIQDLFKRSAVTVQKVGGKYFLPSKVVKYSKGISTSNKALSIIPGKPRKTPAKAYRPSKYKAKRKKITILTGRLIRSLSFNRGAFEFNKTSNGTKEGLMFIKASEERVQAEFGTKVPYAKSLEDGGREHLTPEFNRIIKDFNRFMQKN